ncbi:dehydrogenase/reductase SDR family member 7 [Venturia canescens]|uniref:dehydrogenase/reductase SDR family member 7 n=1 Tax=Venturia canescens TaxID=32260 RepID=UPI001C9C4297|nr:dehydrogenase/reductase SDR family member 7 [Venturia canescens]
MGFCEIVGLFVILYFLFYAIFPWFLDSDVELAFYEKWGRPIESLRGKVVWITGASSGIGEHLAYTLAKVDCKLVLTARRENLINEVKEKCLRINANLKETDVEVLPLDITNTDLHRDAFDRVISKFGKLDILVNNAGRTQRANWEDVDIEVDREVFELNVFSVLSLSRLAVKHFTENGQGHLVVTSSIAGIRGVPFSASYTGSKHALHGYFECLRNEKMGQNIAITMVCPGPIQTPFLAEGFTAKRGVKYGHETEISKMKMAPGRCSKLMAVAIANELRECWIGNSLVMQLTYLAINYPNIGRLLYTYLGPAFMQKLRDSKVTTQDGQGSEGRSN